MVQDAFRTKGLYFQSCLLFVKSQVTEKEAKGEREHIHLTAVQGMLRICFHNL